jgi:UDP-N-acetylglucosamine 2-epimerase
VIKKKKALICKAKNCKVCDIPNSPQVASFGIIYFSDKKYPNLNLFVIKPTRCTNFTNLFSHENLHVSDSSSVHHQFIHRTLGAGICHTAFEQDQDGTAVPSWSCSKVVYKPV